MPANAASTGSRNSGGHLIFEESTVDVFGGRGVPTHSAWAIALIKFIAIAALLLAISGNYDR
jgi:hypothetical protein